MLVLTRKPEEAILLGKDIEITFLSIRGGQVKVGIEAPPEVLVMRKELLEEGKECLRKNR